MEASCSCRRQSERRTPRIARDGCPCVVVALGFLRFQVFIAGDIAGRISEFGAMLAIAAGVVLLNLGICHAETVAKWGDQDGQVPLTLLQ